MYINRREINFVTKDKDSVMSYISLKMNFT